MPRIFLIFGIIPAIVQFIVFFLPFTEKEKKGIVYDSKIAFLYWPLIAGSFAFVCFCFNLADYINTNDKKSLKGVVILSLLVIMAVYLIMHFFRSIIKYDDEKMYYRHKYYYYSDIETFGCNDKHYSFVTKDSKKIKIDHFAVGLDALYKTYAEYKKANMPQRKSKKKKK